MLARVALLAAALAATSGAASDLENLATLHGASGDEGAVADYVVKRLGARAQLDSTGSVTISFGAGGEHLLIAAGLDEPGYSVSEVTDEGYLRLQRLADPAPNYQFDSYFAGRPVLIRRYGQAPLPAVIAAPSVHFASDRGYSSSARGVDRLYVDLGASSKEDVERAGVGALDRVTLRREPFRLAGEDRVASAWISSRAGAAVLLALADHFVESPPKRQVSLAFVTQQHYHNPGLALAWRKLKPAETIVLRPGGGDLPGVGGAAGYSSSLATRLLDDAEQLGLRLERTSRAKLSFGPFNPEGPWPEADNAAVMTVGVEHADTPVETVDFGKLAAVTALLANQAGTDSSGAAAALRSDHELASARIENESGPAFPWEPLLKALTAISGVSGDEGRVRAEIQRRLPEKLRGAAEVDSRGNLIVRLGPAGSPRALFIAHMDEVGFAVTRSTGGGLSLESRGGLAEDLFAYQPLVFESPHGPLPGLMARFGSGDAGAPLDEDVSATVPKAYRRLLGSRVNARSLDDRSGCTVLLHALEQVAAESRLPANAVWFVFSVEEETGLLGAEDLAARSGPTRVYAIDSLVTSDSPLEPTRIAHLRLGDGAAVRAIDNSGIAPRAEVQRIVELARAEGIPLQVGVTAGGNDGSKFVPHGAVNVPLSFPLRYSHTAAEVADLKDIDALARLVTALTRQELAAP